MRRSIYWKVIGKEYSSGYLFIFYFYFITFLHKAVLNRKFEI